MPRPVTDIPNLGPASAEAFARAGITSAEEIIELGADEAYLRLLQSGSAPHFIGYYVLVMGLQGRPWNDCKGEEKKAPAFEWIELAVHLLEAIEKCGFDVVAKEMVKSKKDWSLVDQPNHQ